MTELPPQPPRQPSPQQPGDRQPGDAWSEPAAAARSLRRGRLLAPLAAAVAVVAVTGGVIAIRHNSAGAGSPPQLALVDAGVPNASQADTAVAVAVAGGSVVSPGGDYKVTGSLPTTPTKAKVRTLPGGQAPAGTVSKLATALGLTGTPKRVGGAWVVESGGRQLRVLDGAGQQWLYDNAVRSTGGGMACHVIIDGRRACLPGQAIPGGGGGKVVPIDPPAAQPGGAGANGSSGTASDSSGTANGSSGTASGGGSSSRSNPGSGQLDPAPGAGAYPGATGAPQPPDATTSSGSVGSSQLPPVRPIPGKGVPAPRGTVTAPLPAEPSGPTPDTAKVRAAASGVLAALGLSNADVQVQTFPSLGLVTAAPVVDGLPTAGFEVRLQYNADIQLTGGSGWLATPVAGAEYPLVTAAQALDALPKPEIARVCTDRMPATCAFPQIVITGARLGLALRHDRAGPLLVPAWLYTLQGSGLPPMAVVAVDPKFLSPEKGGSGPGTGTGTGVPPPGQAPPTGATGGPPVPMPKQTR